MAPESQNLSVGKLPHAELKRLLSKVEPDPSVIIGPQIGEDAAVLDFGDRCLVVTTDPITFAADRIGWYVVHVNANDVAVMGARPRWFFAVVLLPEEQATSAMMNDIMTDIRGTCAAVGATLAGGHTEITSNLTRPIVVGQMIGEAPSSRLVNKQRLGVGDRILLTHGVAIEGTAILAREKSSLLGDLVDPETLDRAERLLFKPGISVVQAALMAIDAGEVHGMHDPTEGGLATGLAELVDAAGLGLHIVRERVPIYPETATICDVLGLDPLGLIASGALLIAAPPGDAERIARALQDHLIPVASIGEVRPRDNGLTIEVDGQIQPLVPPDRDEIARVFESRG
jgi:hydrogenase maturation factor